MSLIVVWDGFIKESRFPEQTQYFVPNFLGFSGNLDMSAEEAIANWQSMRKKNPQKKKNEDSSKN